MLFNDVVTLVAVTEGKNQYGELTASTTSTEVMADRQSVGRAEFYQAQTAGYKPEAVFVVRDTDYANQPRLEHNGTTYDIIRTYTKDGELRELVCQRGVR